MTKRTPIIEIDNDKIAIYDSNKAEIVMWDSAEWKEDPGIIVSIANAIHLAHDKGTVAVIETIHPDYVDGYSCPKCFSFDTETYILTRENRCVSCSHKFPLSEEDAASLEENHDGFPISCLEEHACQKAYAGRVAFCEKHNLIPPKDYDAFIEIATFNEWLYDTKGNLKD